MKRVGIAGLMLAAMSSGLNSWNLPTFRQYGPDHVSTCPEVDAKIAAAKKTADAERVAKAEAKRKRKTNPL